MLFALIIAAVAACICYYVRTITYWRRNGVAQGSIFFYVQDFLNFCLRRKSFAETVETYYKMVPSGKRYGGIYQLTFPILMIKDADLLKELTVKSFDHFPDHTNVISDSMDPLWSKNLFSLKGQKWRDMRPILSPSFTSSKMRTIFLLISECAQNFSIYYSKKNEDVIEVELKDSFTRFTNDVIATSAFGIKTNSLENQNNQFYEMGIKLAGFSSGFWNGLKFVFLIFFPKLCEIFKIGLFHKDVARFFVDLIDNTIRVRKEKNIVRPDMIHLLIEAQKGLENKEVHIEDSSFAAQSEHDIGKAVQKELTNMDIAAQAMIFFLAGFETVSSLMCFMSYELAKDPEIQTRLREEIEETYNDCKGQLTYEILLKMKYMDMVVSEALRKWPTAVAVDRECLKAYTIEPKLPGEKPIILKPKQAFWIPIYGLHRDPNIYPEPEKFDPERFSEENKDKINPYTFVPFGLGPRNCIGSRFALLEIKTVFFYLLKNFELVPTKKSKIPLQISKSNFNLTAEGGFWFGLKKLNK